MTPGIYLRDWEVSSRIEEPVRGVSKKNEKENRTGKAMRKINLNEIFEVWLRRKPAKFFQLRNVEAHLSVSSRLNKI